MRFCEIAELNGRRSFKIAALLAFDLNQREGDVLSLSRSAYDGTHVVVRQEKTGTLVKVLATHALRTVLDDVVHNHATIVISEATGLPYKEDYFWHAIAGRPSER
jgi:hypothetical protein